MAFHNMKRFNKKNSPQREKQEMISQSLQHSQSVFHKRNNTNVAKSISLEPID